MVVGTGSEASRDMDLAHQLGAHAFLAKPILLADLDRLAEAVDGHWRWMNRVSTTSEGTADEASFSS